MKKNDEGYILAYVFVILVVICLIATSVLTAPLVNLRIQKAAIERMQDQYTAQGKIEQIIAPLENSKYKKLNNNPYRSISLSELKSFVDKFDVECPVDDDPTRCRITMVAYSGDVQITCVLSVKCEGEVTTVLYGPEIEKYEAYQISSVDVAGGAENGE